MYLHHPHQWFSMRGNFVLQGQMFLNWQCLVTLLVVITEGGSAVGIYWVQARDAAKFPTMHRQDSLHNTESSTVPRLGN